MFKDLRTGIKTYFTTQTLASFYTLTGGRFAYQDGVPQSWTDNYAVFDFYGFQPISCFRTSISEGVFVVDCFSSSATGADNIAAACKTMFDRVTITIPSHNTILPRWSPGEAADRTGDDEDDLWLSIVEFNIRVQ